jgi:hypothetical protein
MRLLDLINQPAQPTQPKPVVPEPVTQPEPATGLLVFSVLYVSPDAHYWGMTEDVARCYGRDCSQVDDDGIGRVYRRCDPGWFAWLVHRTAQAQRLATAGQAPADTVAAIRQRLAAVRRWALHRYGHEIITTAINAGIPRGYQPPVRCLLRDRSESVKRRSRVLPGG